jgi:hypothetical protein
MVLDGRSMPDQAESAESRLYQDERAEAGSKIYPFECGSSGHNINNEDDEEDEEPRPVKRRKRDS